MHFIAYLFKKLAAHLDADIIGQTVKIESLQTRICGDGIR